MPANSLRFDSLAEFEKMFHRLDLPSAVLISSTIYMRHPLLNGGEDFMVSYYYNIAGVVKLYPEIEKDKCCPGAYIFSGKIAKFPQSENEIRETYLKVFNKLNRIYMKKSNKEINSILSAL